MKECPRTKALIEAVKSKKDKLGLIGLDLAKTFEVHPQLVSKWLNYSSVAGGEATMKMLEWLIGRTIDEMLNGATRPPALKATPDDKLVKHARMYAASIIGVTLDENTPTDSIVSILKGHKSWSKDNGFILGDFLLKLRRIKGRDRFDAITAASGLSIETMRIYENTAKSVPVEYRKPWMNFSVAREFARLNRPKQQELMRDIEATIRTSKTPTVRDIREMSRKLRPTRKRRTGNGTP